MRSALKWAVLVVGSLVVLVLVTGFVLSRVGDGKIRSTHDVPLATLAIPSDSAALARGAHLAATSGCQDCHGATLAGAVMEDAPPFRVVASNLTPAGVGRHYSDADFERAIRHGVRPDGRPLLIMPSRAYHGMADVDVAALIAYLRSVPPVENALPATEVRTLGKVLAGVGQLDPTFEVDASASPRSRPPVGPTAAYGAYLHGMLCTYCHGADATGMEAPPGPPGMLPAPSLVDAGRWTRAQFDAALRTGTTPTGRVLDETFMPVSITRQMTDDDLAALYAFYRSLGDRQADA